MGKLGPKGVQCRQAKQHQVSYGTSDFCAFAASYRLRPVQYDAILIVSFGGPERVQDVIPFLENTLRGRNVPRGRMLAVAEHYYHFGGRSPINHHCRELIAALRKEVSLPIYWGNRNWHPMLADTVRRMAADGIRRALAIATSAYPSYSGCRQYIENIEAARAAVGDRAPEIHKLPPFSSHPLFLQANAECVSAALVRIPEERRAAARLVFTAHSIPMAMAATCRYEEQLLHTARFVSEAAGHPEWDLVWQSRSGPPTQPWLEPDVLDHLRSLAENGVKDVVAAPIGFLSDHMEVMYDLDVEAAQLCAELGINLVRAETVGTHPKLIAMLRQLIEERLDADEPSLCAQDCCPAPRGARP
jgi:ferrochelatase